MGLPCAAPSGEGTIHGAGFKVEQAEVLGQVAGNGTLAPPDGPSIATITLRSGEIAPKSLSASLIRASSSPAWAGCEAIVLLFPALAPAARAGLRLAVGKTTLYRAAHPCEGAAIACAGGPGFPGLCTVGMPIALTQAAAVGFAEREFEAPLDGRAALPLERVPLRRASIELRRGAGRSVRCPPRTVGRAKPVAEREPAGRADAVRESALERRTGRLLADDCAGFRSREWVAERLK